MPAGRCWRPCRGRPKPLNAARKSGTDRLDHAVSRVQDAEPPLDPPLPKSNAVHAGRQYDTLLDLPTRSVARAAAPSPMRIVQMSHGRQLRSGEPPDPHRTLQGMPWAGRWKTASTSYAPSPSPNAPGALPHATQDWVLQPPDSALAAPVEKLERTVVDPGRPRHAVALVPVEPTLLEPSQHGLPGYADDGHEFQVGDRKQPLQLGKDAGGRAAADLVEVRAALRVPLERRPVLQGKQSVKQAGVAHVDLGAS